MPVEESGFILDVEDGVATFTMNRPDRLNAFTPEIIDRWVQAISRADKDEAVRALIVTGAGRAFSAGGDVKGIAAREARTVLDHKLFIMRVQRLPLALRAFSKPLLAAVNGPAIGGGFDIALACDIRYASVEATFAQAYVRLGLIPGLGGTYFLPRLIGMSTALELLWTGDSITADQAHSHGIVSKVVAPSELLAETRELAKRLADGPALAIQTIKRLAYASSGDTLADHFTRVSSDMTYIRESSDHREALAAKLEGRTPRYRPEGGDEEER